MSRVRVSVGAFRGGSIVVIGYRAPRPPAGRLSPAEREVARDLADGLSIQAIARRRGVAARTVANQMQSLYRKLGVRSRDELVLELLGAGSE
ncbi:MAG: helix-turn-helix transcriptional regulator [Sandaracinaceae bacterium]|nr:helix-turn-helix transcriptional regulator [Sandaracinaceae bacterium]